MKSDSLKNMFTAKAPLSLYGGLDKGAIGLIDPRVCGGCVGGPTQGL